MNGGRVVYVDECTTCIEKSLSLTGTFPSPVTACIV